MARNATSRLRNRVSAPLEWLGARSLELYLLQFHLLLNRSADRVLWLVSHEDWPVLNFGVCATLWIVAAHRCFKQTAALRDAAEAAPKSAAALLILLAALYAAARLVDAPCASRDAAAALSAAAALCFVFGGYVLADVAARRARAAGPRYAKVRMSPATAADDDDGDDGAAAPPPPPAFAEVDTPEAHKPALRDALEMPSPTLATQRLV